MSIHETNKKYIRGSGQGGGPDVSKELNWKHNFRLQYHRDKTEPEDECTGAGILEIKCKTSITINTVGHH